MDKSIDLILPPLPTAGGVIFGSPEVTPGGRALKFYSSVRIDLRRSESIKIGEELVGNKVRVRVVKNKVAPPFKKSEIEILYNEGISKEGELLDIGVSRNIVEKNGSFYSFKGERLGQGRESVRKFLKNNQEISNGALIRLFCCRDFIFLTLIFFNKTFYNSSSCSPNIIWTIGYCKITRALFVSREFMILHIFIFKKKNKWNKK